MSPHTVKKYVQILETLYVVFLIRPCHRNISRSVLKEPKLYFYDTGYVLGDEGTHFENTFALCLLKHVQYLHDARGQDIDLHYLRTRDGQEVDFVITIGGMPTQFIEVKLSDGKPARSLMTYSKRFPGTEAIQLVHNLRREEEVRGVEILQAGNWFSELSV